MSARLSSVPHGSARLAERRRQRRRRVLITFVVLAILALAGLLYGLNQSAVRISEVTIYGADQSLSDVATSAMQGSYLGLVPRDSMFFYPDGQIRANIMAAHPEIASISIFHNGLTGLSIKVNDRVAVARWCPVENLISNGASSKPSGVENCYVFDANGFVFAPAATTTETINPFAVYAPLIGDVLEPLRATIARADELPSTFDFARQLATFGTEVTRVALRGDEIDDYLASGTRVTYVLGHEQAAFTALTSGKGSMNLGDGSLVYVDLRFDGKVYVKRKSDGTKR